MTNVTLFSNVKNSDVTIAIDDKLVAHYNAHPDFDNYDESADVALDAFWTKFNELLFNQYPNFEDEFDMSELFAQLESLN